MNRKFLSILFLFAFSLFAFSNVKPRNKTISITQPDNTQLTLLRVGNGFISLYQTMDGYIVNKDSDGYYKYVMSVDNDNNIVYSSVSAKDVNSRGKWEEENIHKVYTLERFLSSINPNKLKRQNSTIRELGTISNAALKSIGNPKIPVILVQFSDLKFTVASSPDSIVSFYDKYCNGTNNGKNYTAAGSAGSIKDYFIAQSDSIFMPKFDIIGPITLDSSYVHYGKDSGYQTDININDFWEEAMSKAVNKVEDWTIYDNDKNGSVDIVFFYYAGEGQNGSSDPNTIWPKDWISGGTIGNMKLGSYVCANELFEGKIDGIGLSCHELSHALGLPDLYDIYYNEFGMDYWDLMDSGSYCYDGKCPCGYSAYEKDFMGWKPLIELEPDKYKRITLEPMTAGGSGYKIINKENPDEYYIVENRQNIRWDLGIGNSNSESKHHGMMVTHVDYNKNSWTSNRVNISKNHQRFTIIPADGTLDSYMYVDDMDKYRNYMESMAGDLYPGKKNVTELIGDKAFVYTESGRMNQPITNIIEHENGNITFDFCKNESDAIEDNNVENGIYLDGNELYTLNRSKVYSITGILIGETKGENIPMNLEKGIYIVINNRINKKIIIQ